MPCTSPTATNDRTAKWTGSCPLCETEWTVTAPLSAWLKYEKGALIQDAFPMLAPAERELLMTGICNCLFDMTESDD